MCPSIGCRKTLACLKIKVCGFPFEYDWGWMIWLGMNDKTKTIQFVRMIVTKSDFTCTTKLRYILLRKHYCVMRDLEILNMYTFPMLVAFPGEVNRRMWENYLQIFPRTCVKEIKSTNKAKNIKQHKYNYFL